MRGRQALIPILVPIILATSITGLASNYVTLGYYDVIVILNESPPQLVMLVNVPLLPGSPLENMSNADIVAEWFITKSLLPQYGVDVLRVEYTYSEFYEYAGPSSLSWSLKGWVNESRAYVESTTYMHDTGELLRYVRLEVVADKDPFLRLMGEPVSYTIEAVLYGSDFENLTVSEVRDIIGELIGPELALVIPYHALCPECLDKWFSNRTIESVDVTYSDGEYHAVLRLVDANKVLPVIAMRNLTISSMCKQALGPGYTCTYYSREQVIQVISIYALETVLDKLYNEWRLAVDMAESRGSELTSGEFEELWRDTVIPVEGEINGFLSLVYSYPAAYFPQDPFLWLTITDSIINDIGSVSITTRTSFENPPMPRSTLGTVYTDYESLEKFLNNTAHIPVEIVFYYKHAGSRRVLFETSSYILEAIYGGNRLVELPRIMPMLMRSAGEPRIYTQIPLTDLLVSPSDLYNATAIITLDSENLRAYCKLYVEALIAELADNKCIVKGPLAQIAQFLYEYYYPAKPTETMTLVEETPYTTPTPTTTHTPSATTPTKTPYSITLSSDTMIYLLYTAIIATSLAIIILTIKKT